MSKVTIDYLRSRGRSFIGKDGHERIEVPLRERQWIPGTREATIKAYLPDGVHLVQSAWNRFVVIVEAPAVPVAQVPTSRSVVNDGFGAGVEIG